jgi:hypothetical protein
MDAAKSEGRAIAMMYDLSGLNPGEDCTPIIEDWKELVDQMRITNQGEDQTYLYHDGKPVVGIWGLGFPDRPYDIQDIGIDVLIDFLQNDPVYGGCAVMLGVPSYFTELNVDTNSDAFLHEVIESADIIFPWYVQRFTPLLHAEFLRYFEQVKSDKAWSDARGVDFAALVYPGFSWYNLSSDTQKPFNPPGAIPRQAGNFYWGQLQMAIEAGAEMLYVAMFDEVDEGTSIFKCTNQPPVSEVTPFQTYEGLPSDFYLQLTQAAKQLLETKLSE